jgi:FixJ family two-component response regulator
MKVGDLRPRADLSKAVSTELTVFVIDDEEPVCASLLMLLRAEGIRSRSFPSGKAFLEQFQPDCRGCIIIDHRMPEMDGMTLIRELRQIGCTLPVIFITGHGDVPLAVSAMKAGVADFIEKPFNGDDILAAVRQCLEQTCRQEARESERAAIERRIQRLTARESQVMNRLIEGRSNKEIGLELNISPRTVEIYRTNVMVKMETETLADLVRSALKIANDL